MRCSVFNDNLVRESITNIILKRGYTHAGLCDVLEDFVLGELTIDETLAMLNRMVSLPFSINRETDSYVRFVQVDNLGNHTHLKVYKLGREEN